MGAALALAAAAAPTRFKEGPPPAHTGGFGEPTCRQCHSDAGLNEPGGRLAITGFPPGYQPGRTYELAVSLERAGMLRAGFQLAARFAAGAGGGAGTQAGALAPADGRTAVVFDSGTGISYIEHTLAGTALAPRSGGEGGAARWTFRWTAPADPGGAVVMHLTANAANDDDSPLGDFIYATAVSVAAGRQ
ncbi:MAG TPA: choice-of-anchor V domain-containing protein [Gemmatimonadales bacterium]|nr:choice-of-anchor V domain-containing protein [Gemmatimonadales bacterium]